MSNLPIVPVEHGDVIYTPARTTPLAQLGVRHFGIWDAVNRQVIHNALPFVQLATWEQFANGIVHIAHRARPRYQNTVVERARALLGQKYDLLTFNCEHFVNFAAVGEKQSPQLHRAVGWGIVGAVGAWALRAFANSPTYDSSADRYRGRDGRFRRG